MRSITVTMWVSLDGVVQGLGRPDEDTRGGFAHGGWGTRYQDEVMGREMAEAMAKPGDMLFGRRTWQDLATYLRVEGSESAGIALVGNDLRKARKAIDVSTGVPAGAVVNR